MMQPVGKDEWVREHASGAPLAWIGETWRARGLVMFFAHLALLKTTRRTVLGWVWLPLRSLVPTLIGTLVIGGFFGVSTPTVPYPLFLVSGLIPWVMFASSATWSVRCLELTKRYRRASAFPRLVLPLGFTAPAILEGIMFLATYILLLAWFAFKGYVPLVPSIDIIAYLFMAWLAGLGIGLTLSIPGVHVRDIRFTLAFTLSALFMLTPVSYPATVVPESWGWLISINPLAALVDGFRSAMFGLPGLSPEAQLMVVAFSLVLFGTGLFVFNRFEKTLD